MCVSELRGLGEAHDAIAKKGGKLYAIASSPLADLEKMVEERGIAFPVLSDPDCSVIRAYGLLHENGGPQGEAVAVPAHFLIEKAGRIVWRFTSRLAQDRPHPDDVVKAIEGL